MPHPLGGQESALARVNPALLARLEALEAERIRLTGELSLRVKARAAGRPIPDWDDIVRLVRACSEEFAVVLAEVQRQAGISEEVLAALEAKGRHPRDGRTSWDEIVSVPSGSWLDDHCDRALAALLPLVDPSWLEGEDRKLYRLDPRAGLELANGHVLDRRPERAHRFAQMLLLTRDFLAGEQALDMFTMAMLVPVSGDR